jgi:hypothetical protein
MRDVMRDVRRDVGGRTTAPRAVTTHGATVSAAQGGEGGLQVIAQSRPHPRFV